MGNNQKILLLLSAVTAVVIIAVAVVVMRTPAPIVGTEPGPVPAAPITNFGECVAAGHPVMESYPRQCRTGNETFTEDIGNELDKADLIRLDSPRPNAVIESPLSVTGQARGTWFFEASFPVVLVDWDGLIIAQGIATAKDDWMTGEFVPFEAELTFSADPAAYSDRGTLILRKDNPSGLPENDDALEVPVVFRSNNPSGGVGIMPLDSGVTGVVRLGPVCPVFRDPPDPACAAQPYRTTVQVIAVGSPNSAPFAVVESDEEGQYTAMLPPGEYALQPVGGERFPSCTTTPITIEPGVVIEVDLNCETGIR